MDSMLPVLSFNFIWYIRSFLLLSVSPPICLCLDFISLFKVFVFSLQSVCLPLLSNVTFFSSAFSIPLLDMFSVSHLSVCPTLTSCFGSWEWPPLMNGCFFAFYFYVVCLFLLNISLSLHIFWVGIKAMEVWSELKLNGRK